MSWIIPFAILIAGSSAFAQNIEWSRKTAAGEERIQLKYSAQITTFSTNTTAYSKFGKPAILGSFERTARGSQIMRLDAAKAKQSNFKSTFTLKAKNPPKIMLDGKQVPAGSKAYWAIERMVASESNDSSWKIVDGTIISTKGSQVVIEDWTGGKKVKSESRSPASICANQKPGSFCKLSHGIYYLPVKSKPGKSTGT